MKSYKLEFDKFESLSDEEMKTYDGGGWLHKESADAQARAVRDFANAVGEFFGGVIDGIADGYERATRNNGHL